MEIIARRPLRISFCLFTLNCEMVRRHSAELSRQPTHAGHTCLGLCQDPPAPAPHLVGGRKVERVEPLAARVANLRARALEAHVLEERVLLVELEQA